MRIKALIFTVFCLSGIFGCKNTVTNISTKEFYNINVDSIQDILDLKLSDIADSFRLVRLETSGKSIINARDYYISDKYIIAASQDGFYKYTSNGEFSKKIFSYGRGPDEISGWGYSYYYDEKKDLLYLDDENLRQNFLVYDLNLEKFIEPIKKAIPGRPMGQIAVYNDSLVIGKSSGTPEPYAIMMQNFDGKFVSGIRNTKMTLWGDDPQEHYQRNIITIGQNTFRIRFEFDDTIFTFKDNKLIPYISLDFKKHREYPPNARAQKEDRQISIPKAEPSGFLIITVSTVEEITWFGSNSKSKHSYKYLFFDKSTGKSSIIRTYEDDFTGDIQSSEGMVSPNMYGTIKFPDFLKNDKLYVIYQPETIKRIAERSENGQIKSILTPILKKEIVDICKDLEETDNPILLVGRVKEKI
jgi:hypothetical protein